MKFKTIVGILRRGCCAVGERHGRAQNKRRTGEQLNTLVYLIAVASIRPEGACLQVE
jgi:hypothetical protein